MTAPIGQSSLFDALAATLIAIGAEAGDGDGCEDLRCVLKSSDLGVTV